jgi:hypothetical protein
MQTLNIDGTSYKVKFDKDPIAWAKAARKPWKPAKPKDLRKFPARSDLTTAEYFRQFDQLNFLASVKYDNLNFGNTAQYDHTMPLLEDLSNENAY